MLLFFCYRYLLCQLITWMFFFISTLPVKHYAVCFSLASKLSCVCSLTLRDIQKVLREDKERLRQMQKSQPHFSSDQRRELVEEHPWMRRGGLPAAINVKVRTTHVLCFSNISLLQHSTSQYSPSLMKPWIHLAWKCSKLKVKTVTLNISNWQSHSKVSFFAFQSILFFK